jgi:hypothetical protein
MMLVPVVSRDRSRLKVWAVTLSIPIYSGMVVRVGAISGYPPLRRVGYDPPAGAPTQEFRVSDDYRCACGELQML